MAACSLPHKARVSSEEKRTCRPYSHVRSQDRVQGACSYNPPINSHSPQVEHPWELLDTSIKKQKWNTAWRWSKTDLFLQPISTESKVLQPFGQTVTLSFPSLLRRWRVLVSLWETNGAKRDSVQVCILNVFVAEEIMLLEDSTAVQKISVSINHRIAQSEIVATISLNGNTNFRRKKNMVR